MYVTRVEIQNIRSIKNLVWEIDASDAPGWHVILGDNGAGKSTVLRSIGLALVGPPQILALRQDFNKWITQGENASTVSLSLILDRNLDFPRASRYSPVPLKIQINRGPNTPKITKAPEDLPLYDQATSGWFAASYGPLRRFTGGDQEEESLMRSNPRLARHLSAFSERVALTEGFNWLKELRFQTLEVQTRVDTASADIRVLRRTLAARLSRDELAAIWFDTFNTSIEEVLPNTSLQVATIELLTRTSQQNLLDRLIDSIRIERPDILSVDKNDQTSKLSLCCPA